jgi:hypothetical protein
LLQYISFSQTQLVLLVAFLGQWFILFKGAFFNDWFNGLLVDWQLDSSLPDCFQWSLQLHSLQRITLHNLLESSADWAQSYQDTHALVAAYRLSY